MPYKDPKKAKEAKKKWDQKHRKGKRHTVWLAIFYEEDCPGWQQELTEVGVPCLVSPAHDKDKWTAHDAAKYADRGVVAGKFKKRHRHLVAEYPNAVDYETFRKDFHFLGADDNGPHNVKYAKSKSASTLYLAHETEDCKKAGKAEYDPTLILAFCGADYEEWKASLENVHAEMKKMRAFVMENNITEMWEFWNWCDENNDDWSRLLDTRCAWAMGTYIDRRRKALEAEERAAEMQGGLDY